VGPVHTSDSTNNEYLVPPPKKPDIPDTGTQTEKPSYPFRPRTRPPVVQPTSPPKIPPQPVPEVTPRVFTGKQRTWSMVTLKYKKLGGTADMVIVHKGTLLDKIGICNCK
jgi:hypothetical protein